MWGEGATNRCRGRQRLVCVPRNRGGVRTIESGTHTQRERRVRRAAVLSSASRTPNSLRCLGTENETPSLYVAPEVPVDISTPVLPNREHQLRQGILPAEAPTKNGKSPCRGGGGSNFPPPHTGDSLPHAVWLPRCRQKAGSVFRLRWLRCCGWWLTTEWVAELCGDLWWCTEGETAAASSSGGQSMEVPLRGGRVEILTTG